MGVYHFELPRHEHPFIGTWHIYSMELWGASYFNMETQAYIEIRPENLGSFRFGLVSGGLNGHLESKPPNSDSYLPGRAAVRWIRRAEAVGSR